MPGESPDRETWQATAYRIIKSWTLPKRPCVHRLRLFFPCGSSAPVRVKCEGGVASWLAGTLAEPSVQGQGLPPLQELWPYLSLFSSLLQLVIRRPLWPVFVCSSVQALRGLPSLGPFCCLGCRSHRGALLAGVLLCRLARQALKGVLWVGPSP